MKRLVVVESPTKARTIRNFLPKDGFRVEASMGHIRDLPASAAEVPAHLKHEEWARLGVRIDRDFEPLYVIPRDKRKVVQQLKEALKEADELYIATDEDREGESIGWHLVEVLKPKVPVRRMVFHEITREAIEQALRNPRDIDHNLVEAQEARRILDRLVGYLVSPVLWRKIAPRLSAGRVQSAAVRLLVLREKERIAFVPATYWDLKALLEQAGQTFEAVLTHVGGIRVAGGKDFDEHTGRLKEGLVAGRDVILLDEAQARELAERLRHEGWVVADVEERVVTRSPAPPFITSTLQQEASRKLGLSARQTMQIAQRLYEQGYITYMRTDSTHLSQEAIEASRRTIVERYGKEYLSPQPRQYQSRVRNAQEAHEAIRPAGRAMKTAEELGLTGIDAALYDLIWKRTVASQMADARLRLLTVHLEAGDREPIARFRASGRTVEFPGFFRAYVEGSDDPEAALEDRDQPLPPLKKGDRPRCVQVESRRHETRPPARYTEATLVKTLEQEGIGRPSTYATIIDTILQRGYAVRRGNQLVPTFMAFATNNLLEACFEKLVDLGFTAQMEEALDEIAQGRQKTVPYLRQFYQGEEGLERMIDEALRRVDPREVSTIRFPQWEPYVVRVGKYGPYVEGPVDGQIVTASLPPDLAPGDVTREKLEQILREGQIEDRVLGIDPETGMPVLLRRGPYGYYVQLGDDEQAGKPKRVALPPGMEPAVVDLETARALLQLPRTLGTHPETGQPVLVGIGRYGPYVQHGRTFASLKEEDDVFTIDLERALELLAEKEARSRPLRVLGTHPETGEPVEVWEGRYGPYVKHGRTNASLPEGRAPEAITLEEALALLEEKASRKEKTRGRRRRSK
ncbi:type I DNA topoisomerase [Rhodothermus marinus]|uniref:DNA topoisomerase 1 n=1 Tax=Rhodothermus marinus (strain ATCC 43812 / DSM 4252 / R-10) TaxID=518766 RepID=D0MJD2_RHOM4|nr:type I DNA topoisomerase [Rhodothermus marinus]ACY48590.1 DNA topoisomerase I [Rhodothermus marinus DSM 4252]